MTAGSHAENRKSRYAAITKAEDLFDRKPKELSNQKHSRIASLAAQRSIQILRTAQFCLVRSGGHKPLAIGVPRGPFFAHFQVPLRYGRRGWILLKKSISRKVVGALKTFREPSKAIRLWVLPPFSFLLRLPELEPCFPIPQVAHRPGGGWRGARNLTKRLRFCAVNLARFAHHNTPPVEQWRHLAHAATSRDSAVGS